MRTDRKSSGQHIRHVFHTAGKAILKITTFFWCFACVHTPTQTCWINLLLRAQIWTYHPLVTNLPWNKNRVQGKTNITVAIKKKVLWNESLHSSDSKHRLLLVLCKLTALIFSFHISIHDILVSPHLKYLKSRSIINVDQVPRITEACEVTCSYSNTIFLSSFRIHQMH